jgi:phenylacetate-coenzyme A ligase PaaK-like adenylate-forming protein
VARCAVIKFAGSQASNSIYQLAQMALEQSLDAPPLKAVITTSEKVTPEMRAVIERAFATELFEEYAAVEDVFFVSENEQRRKLISPDAGLLEIIDDTFAPVSPAWGVRAWRQVSSVHRSR